MLRHPPPDRGSSLILDDEGSRCADRWHQPGPAAAVERWRDRLVPKGRSLCEY